MAILATIPSSWKANMSYYHSFGMSENYLVFIEQPLIINSLKLIATQIKGKTMHDCMMWSPEERVIVQCMYHEKYTYRHSLTYVVLKNYKRKQWHYCNMARFFIVRMNMWWEEGGSRILFCESAHIVTHTDTQWEKFFLDDLFCCFKCYFDPLFSHNCDWKAS